MNERELPLLVIGNKSYSSWSLRAWLLLRTFGVAFRELKLPLDTPEFDARIRDYSPSGRVPALLDGEIRVWDTLAIAEYANERWLGGRGWPADRAARAHARAISAEMHAGFGPLLHALPFNCCKRVQVGAVAPDVAADIGRIQSIWRETRERYGRGGAFLFGAFGIADAMYAPVVLRFISYDIGLDPDARAYAAAIVSLAALGEWLAEAATEPQSEIHERIKP